MSKSFYKDSTVEVELNGKKVRIAKKDKSLFEKVVGKKTEKKDK